MYFVEFQLTDCLNLEHCLNFTTSDDLRVKELRLYHFKTESVQSAFLQLILQGKQENQATFKCGLKLW